MTSTRLPGTADCTAGTVMGDYVLNRTIGQGAFGKVKLGTHLPTGEKVAIKILNKAKVLTPQQDCRFLREMEIMKRMTHTHVVQLYEVRNTQILETSRHVYLVMEYASEGDLLSYILSQQRIREPEACRLMHQLVSGVGYLHSLGIVHRDLKPDNVLLDQGKTVKIADFGLSNYCDREGWLSSHCGSPGFAAPEIFNSQQYNGQKVDIWSLGVLLFTMLSGFLPFEDENRAALFRKIRSGRYQCPSFLSSEARNLIRRMLTVDPAMRISLEEIQDHPWWSLALGSSPDPVPMPDASEVLRKIERLGYDPKSVEKSLQLGLKNSGTAAFHLLLKKRIQRSNAAYGLWNCSKLTLRVQATPATLQRDRTKSKALDCTFLIPLSQIPKTPTPDLVSLTPSGTQKHPSFPWRRRMSHTPKPPNTRLSPMQRKEGDRRRDTTPRKIVNRVIMWRGKEQLT